MSEPSSERIEPGVEAAHRDDLARDVAELWATLDEEAVPCAARAAWPELGRRLDRLTKAYSADEGAR